MARLVAISFLHCCGLRAILQARRRDGATTQSCCNTIVQWWQERVQVCRGVVSKMTREGVEVRRPIEVLDPKIQPEDLIRTSGARRGLYWRAFCECRVNLSVNMQEANEDDCSSTIGTWDMRYTWPSMQRRLIVRAGFRQLGAM